MTEINLKSCPFCGHSAKLLTDAYSDGTPAGYYVECQNDLCKAQSCERSTWGAAQNAWNRRVTHVCPH